MIFGVWRCVSDDGIELMLTTHQNMEEQSWLADYTEHVCDIIADTFEEAYAFYQHAFLDEQRT